MGILSMTFTEELKISDHDDDEHVVAKWYCRIVELRSQPQKKRLCWIAWLPIYLPPADNCQASTYGSWWDADIDKQFACLMYTVT